MTFRASFCDPFRSDIIELGEIRKNEIIDRFRSIDWKDYLDRMSRARESEIHFSPSLEIENTGNRHGLSVSAVDEGKGTLEFYIFYKRPENRSKLFGLVKYTDENYTTSVTGQSSEDVIACLTALIEGNLEMLREKVR
ncbi:MAG: hypothetical protein LUE26_05690 [Alistipes sp.]|nr:hypothetical protein [Alistipes sp.]